MSNPSSPPLVLHLERPLVFFDLEATGTDPQAARIIQIGMQRFVPSEDGAALDETIDVLVDPEEEIPAAVTDLTGLSPDDSPTSDDLRRAERVISDHDLDHVLAPVMESEQAAAGIVSDTSARERLPITALPGRHSEWADRGWGYEQIMSEVNLPTLETALGSR